MGNSPVKHIFVLMLENRSFDHMLGFSGFSGTDAATGAPTKINGLTGSEFNTSDGTSNGTKFTVTKGADFRMPVDPGHEFADVLHQLAGPTATYPPAGPYPAITNSGYVASYVASGGGSNPGELMKCFTLAQLPVLNELAQEFVLCDNWHASMPGPTWPNRMFVHAASSGGLEHSPSTLEMIAWETVDGFRFPHGSIFDQLELENIPWRLYGGDDFPMVAALKGIHLDDIRHFSDFPNDLKAPFPFSYVFIEPSYDILNDYKNGTSQHPLADVTQGEALIKTTYEAIRSSALWPSSLLIVTWDEHGGFFDHAIPPAAVAPGDTAPNSPHNKAHFTFQQYGPRVPAVVISPLIPRNLIDHRLYDHSSVPKLVETTFGLSPMTARDTGGNSLAKLVTLPTARTDAPLTLNNPADSGAGVARTMALAAAAPERLLSVARPADTVNQGNFPAILQSALHQDLAISPAQQRDAILKRVESIRTREEARQYFEEVRQKLDASRGPKPAGS